MVFGEVTVVQIKEALRRWLLGEGERPIAHGVDRKTARRYVAAALEARAGPVRTPAPDRHSCSVRQGIGCPPISAERARRCPPPPARPLDRRHAQRGQARRQRDAGSTRRRPSRCVTTATGPLPRRPYPRQSLGPRSRGEPALQHTDMPARTPAITRPVEGHPSGPRGGIRDS